METWEKSRFLGEGSYGKVFLASPANGDEDDDRVIAVKSAKIDDTRRCNSLEAEATILEDLIGEPNIVRCLGEDWSVEDDQNTYNLLLEYANGGTLLDLVISSPQMYATRIVYFARMLLTGLSRIHSHGIADCDLKLENILVFRTIGHPLLKIADFGVARMVSARQVSEVWDKKYRNRGTTLYASSESVAKGEHGTCGDVWSLGIMVAEMMMGRHFWDPDRDLYKQIVYEPLDLEERVPGRFDEDATDFLERCLDGNHKIGGLLSSCCAIRSSPET